MQFTDMLGTLEDSIGNERPKPRQKGSDKLSLTEASVLIFAYDFRKIDLFLTLLSANCAGRNTSSETSEVKSV